MHTDGDSNKLLSELREMQVSDAAAFDKQAWLDQHEPDMRAKLEALESNQADIDNLLEAFMQERKDLERKYEGLLGPHYKVRMDIVAGKIEPQSYLSSPRGVPGFWLKVLKSHPEIQDRISEKDEMVLQHLVGVVGSRLCPEQGGVDTFGFTLDFFFTPNDFFAEKQLSLEVRFADQDESVIKGIEGTRISWRCPGMNPTVKVKKKSGVKGANKLKMDSAESFFKLFSPILPPCESTIDANEYEVMKQDAEDCLAVAMTLMEDMIPHAVKYFSGEKTFESEFDVSTEYGDGGESDDEEQSEDDHNSDNHADQNPSAVQSRIMQGNQQDCKQQ